MKKALVVVDYQYDFVCGSLGFLRAVSLDERIDARIKKALEENEDLLFTLDTHGENYSETQEGKKLPIKHCIKGTQGHDLFGMTAKHLPQATKVFEKPCFGSAQLFDWLRTADYDEVELCGLVTNICIVSNAVLAKTALPEARVVVNRNLVSCADARLHEQTLELLLGIQVEVIE